MTAPASVGSARARSSARAAAHAPAHGADAGAVDVGPRAQVGERGLEIPHGAVLRHPAHELVRGVGIVGHLAAVEVRRSATYPFFAKSSALPFMKSFNPHHSWITTIAGFFPAPSGTAR